MQADDEKISNEDYTTVQHQIITMARLVRDLPLAAFLNRIQSCESVTPIFNPSLYMRGAKKLELVKQMAEGLLEFQKSIPELQAFVDAELHQRAVEQMQGIDE